MKRETVLSIAVHVSRVLGVRMPNLSIEEIIKVAGSKQSKESAARAIAEQIFRHRFDEELNSLDRAILDVKGLGRQRNNTYNYA